MTLCWSTRQLDCGGVGPLGTDHATGFRLSSTKGCRLHPIHGADGGQDSGRFSAGLSTDHGRTMSPESTDFAPIASKIHRKAVCNGPVFAFRLFFALIHRKFPADRTWPDETTRPESGANCAKIRRRQPTAFRFHHPGIRTRSRVDLTKSSNLTIFHLKTAARRANLLPDLVLAHTKIELTRFH